MQAGTTGINAMRVYNVTKQGQDQDPDGVFIRKYIPELRKVPNEYIHEPYKMSISLQKKYAVLIEGGKSNKAKVGLVNLMTTDYEKEVGIQISPDECFRYPFPIVDEKASAKVAKEKLSAVRKQVATREEAQKVYIQHGSRRFRGENRNSVMSNASSNVTKRPKVAHEQGQQSLLVAWSKSPSEVIDSKQCNDDDSVIEVSGFGEHFHMPRKMSKFSNDETSLSQISAASPKGHQAMPTFFFNNQKQRSANIQVDWHCQVCTYLNRNILHLACEMCGSERR